jgi:hypothetical protein
MKFSTIILSSCLTAYSLAAPIGDVSLVSINKLEFQELYLLFQKRDSDAVTNVDATTGNEAFYGIKKRGEDAITNVDATTGSEAFYGIKH